MFGEEILSHDPYNFNTLEEFIAHHFPELLEEETKEFEDANSGASLEDYLQSNIKLPKKAIVAAFSCPL